MKQKIKSYVAHQEYFDKEQNMVRQSVKEFVNREITPFIDDWEEAGEFPRDLYKKAANIGILGLGYPEKYGGIPGDIFFKIAVEEELMRSGSGGLVAGLLGSLNISIPPLLDIGTEEQKERFLKPVLSGDKITALAVTEPKGGSDVANLDTTAVKDQNNYIVNGSKIFITSGYRADQITCAVRTGEKGQQGVSLLIIESDTPGYSVSKKMRKTGWWASDTAEIFFDNCQVPAENLLGKENKGFQVIMKTFEKERLHLAILANMTAQLAFEASLEYAKERIAFGRPIQGFQVIRHKLADMATMIEISREFTYKVAARIDSGISQTKEVSMAKNFATSVSDKVTYDAVQIFGGYGFMRGNFVERLYRDNRVLSIGGGTTEIMKEIISKAIL